jgi:hypothetical protein
MIASARMTPQQEGNLTKLFLNDPLPQGMGTTYNSPKFGVLSAYSLTQGVDMTQQQALTATNIAVTPAEVGVQIVLTKKSMAQWSEDVAARAGVIMRQAMDRKKDADIAGLFLGFSRTMGGDTAVPTLGHITAAIALLESGTQLPADAAVWTAGNGYDSCSGPFIGVISPISTHYLVQGLAGGVMLSTSAVLNPGADGMPGSLKNAAVRQGARALGELGGAMLYVNPNLGKIVTTDVSVGFLGEKNAIVFVPMDYDSLGGLVEEDDKSLRAIEINYVEDYGFAELDDGKGIRVNWDNVKPTT